MLYTLIDGLRQTNWLLANKDLPRNKRSPAPQPLPRPGDRAKPRTKKQVTFDRLRDFKERHRKHE